MPFTLSHAAAALPFRKFKPIWPALVVGTFAPDLQYFLFISDDDRSWHRYPEVLLYTIPFALLTLWVFEWVVKRSAIELLPTGVQQRLHDRLEPLPFSGWKQLAAIVMWIAIGIATHIVWDQFTHSYSWLAGHWISLQRPVSLPLVNTYLLAHLLQHISTIGGFLVLCAWFVAWYRRTSPAPRMYGEEFSLRFKLLAVLTMSGVALLMGYPLALWRLATHEPPIKRSFFIATVFEATTLVFCVQLLIFGLALTLNSRWRPLPSGQLQEPGD
jgi:hypothetical protein